MPFSEVYTIHTKQNLQLLHYYWMNHSNKDWLLIIEKVRESINYLLTALFYNTT